MSLISFLSAFPSNGTVYALSYGGGLCFTPMVYMNMEGL